MTLYIGRYEGYKGSQFNFLNLRRNLELSNNVGLFQTIRTFEVGLNAFVLGDDHEPKEYMNRMLLLEWEMSPIDS